MANGIESRDQINRPASESNPPLPHQMAEGKAEQQLDGYKSQCPLALMMMCIQQNQKRTEWRLRLRILLLSGAPMLGT